MRITGGEYGGRILEAPKDNKIRPTSDKVRLAIFNMLDSRGLVEDAIVLDAFCGTGALGIEAISRGAAQAVFIDKNRSSLDLSKKNYSALKIAVESHFLLKDSSKIGEKPSNIAPATLVFLDPPYNQNLVPLTLESLLSGGWLVEGAHIVVETEKGSFLAISGFQTLIERDYGDTRIALLARTD